MSVTPRVGRLTAHLTPAATSVEGTTGADDRATIRARRCRRRGVARPVTVVPVPATVTRLPGPRRWERSGAPRRRRPRPLPARGARRRSGDARGGAGEARGGRLPRAPRPTPGPTGCPGRG